MTRIDLLTEAAHASIDHEGIPGVGEGGGGGGGIAENLAIPDAGSSLWVIPGVIIASTDTAPLGVDTLGYIPIWLRETLHVDNLVCEVTSGNGASRNMRVGLYETDANLQPTDLVAEGAIDASTTGVKTVSVDEDLSPGRYLLAWNVNHGTPNYRRMRGLATFVKAHSNFAVAYLRRSATTYGAHPSTGLKWLDTVDATFGWVSPIWLEVSAP